MFLEYKETTRFRAVLIALFTATFWIYACDEDIMDDFSEMDSERDTNSRADLDFDAEEGPDLGSVSIARFENDQSGITIADEDRFAIMDSNAAIARQTGASPGWEELYKIRMKYISKALAKAVVHPGIAKSIRQKVSEQFDGDFNTLWSSIKQETIENTTVESLVESRFSGLNRSQLLNLFDIPLLQIAIPESMDKWNADKPLLVAFMTYEVDDTELKEITAYDLTGKEYVLDAQVAPQFPVIVVSLNERVNPLTGRFRADEIIESSEVYDREFAEMMAKSRALASDQVELVEGDLEKKFTISNPESDGTPSTPVVYQPLHVYLEWFYTNTDSDPWPSGRGEFRAAVMTDAGVLDNRPYKNKYYVRNGVRSGRWYQPKVGLFQYSSAFINRYATLRYYEEDTWKFDFSMRMSLKMTGVVDKDIVQTFDSNVTIGNGDDILGAIQFDVALGPMNPLESQHNNYLSGSGQHTAIWWGGKNNDAVITGLPYSSSGSNTNRPDRWPVVEWAGVSSPDYTYLVYCEQPMVVNVNTCGSTTLDTWLTIRNQYGAIEAHNDDWSAGGPEWPDPSCIRYQSALVTYLDVGYHYITVDGYRGQTGNFVLNMRLNS